MATATRVPQGDVHVPGGKTLIGYEEAVEQLSEDQSLRATVYAMNTLLIQKGYYSVEEFRFQFRQSAERQLKRRR
jgi:hypothetical protein